MIYWWIKWMHELEGQLDASHASIWMEGKAKRSKNGRMKLLMDELDVKEVCSPFG